MILSEWCPKIDASEYAKCGYVTCTQQGCIVWQGPLFFLSDIVEFDIVHCHDDDVDEVLRALNDIKGRKLTLTERLSVIGAGPQRRAALPLLDFE